MKYTIEELTTESSPSSNAILFQNGNYYEFSNFHPGSLIVDGNGLIYATVEAYFQANKSTSLVERMMFDRHHLSEHDAGKSKAMGRKLQLRSDWEEIKYDVMREGLRQKFQDPILHDLLLSTGDKELVEWTYWGDRVWGMCDKTNSGANALGKLLMEIRSQLCQEK